MPFVPMQTHQNADPVAGPDQPSPLGPHHFSLYCALVVHINKHIFYEFHCHTMRPLGSLGVWGLGQLPV